MDPKNQAVLDAEVNPETAEEVFRKLLEAAAAGGGTAEVTVTFTHHDAPEGHSETEAAAFCLTCVCIKTPIGEICKCVLPPTGADC